MKILIPILGFAKQGGYRVLSELANAWIRMGHECTFLIPATSCDAYFPTAAKVIRCGMKGITTTVDERSASGFDNVASLFFGLKSIGSEYDVILANHSLTAWPVRWANCGSAKKFYYVQAYEPGYYAWMRDPFKRLFSKISYSLQLEKISNSATYSADGVSSCVVIPPGIDLGIFVLKDNKVVDFNKPEVIVGTIGRLEPYKGTATALAAYRSVRKKYPNLVMKVAFGNVEPAEDIEIVRIQGDAELAEYYRSLDILIVSCYSQHGAPHYPLIEGMASGVPVVQTQYYPGDENNSWPAKSSSIDDVVIALENLLGSSPMEIAKKIDLARKTVEDELSWDRVALRFLNEFSK